MNNLHRELAPISDAAWADLEQEARPTFQRHVAGRRIVDVPEPGGLERLLRLVHSRRASGSDGPD
jgi:uncharacterized linocin/CFP29 family protein